MDPNTPTPLNPLPNFTSQSAPTSAPSPTPANPDLVGDISPSVLSAPFVPNTATPSAVSLPPIVTQEIGELPTVSPVATPAPAPTPAPATVAAPPVVEPANPLAENPDDVKTIK